MQTFVSVTEGSLYYERCFVSVHMGNKFMNVFLYFSENAFSKVLRRHDNKKVILIRSWYLYFLKANALPNVLRDNLFYISAITMP